MKTFFYLYIKEEMPRLPKKTPTVTPAVTPAVTPEVLHHVMIDTKKQRRNRLNAEQKRQVLLALFEWSNVQRLNEGVATIEDIRRELDLNVSLRQLTKIAESYTCDYDENHKITTIYDKLDRVIVKNE